MTRVATGVPSPRRRQRHAIGWLCALIVVVVTVAIVHAATEGSRAAGFARPAYAPQPGRNAEWTGNPKAHLSDDEVTKIAENAGIEVLPKFADNWDINAHFAETSRLVSAARSAGNTQLKVYEYFNATFWYTQNQSGWGQFASGFRQSWLLRDHAGHKIPFYGAGGTVDTASAPLGYMIDLSNSAYRTWATNVILQWMRRAPYAGIAIDSANPLFESSSVRRSVGKTDTANYATLLCGDGATHCAKVTDWNDGLTSLLSTTSAALHKIGDQVMYNGIAPSAQRGPDRNLDLLNDADIAVNESFCFSVAGGGGKGATKAAAYNIIDDAAVMSKIAGEHKKVLEITNYQDPPYRAFGDYCLAGFLMGWQPGSSYYAFHSGYSDPLTGAYPEIPEQNLQLGQPATNSYQATGGVLSRSFDHGFVAMNTTGVSATVHVPISGVSFLNGLPHGTYVDGATADLPAHSALFMLSNSYLYATG